MLSDEERRLAIELIERGEPLPDRFRFTLFAEPREAELIWPGKTAEVTNVVLPFQCIEQIDEPRAEVDVGAFGTADLFGPNSFGVGAGGRQSAGWSNKLIWGDNKLVLSSLKGGPLRRQIEEAGGLKLVYIDPPFDVGADFSFTVEVGEEEVRKEPSVLEDVAYRDTWGRGKSSFLSMLAERLQLIYSLLADGGSLFLHLDYHAVPECWAYLNELFGAENYHNDIVWYYYRFGVGGQKQFTRAHDTVLWFSKGRNWTFNLDAVRVPYSEKTKANFTGGVGGSGFGSGELNDKGKIPEDHWEIAPAYKSLNEVLPYPTQKPEKLLNRIMEGCSKPGDLVADFFCGSGTTLAVAEKLGRKWIGADLGRFAIHTSRKRLIGVQRQLKAEGKPYRSFEILNLGKYERQWFVGIDPTLPEDQRRVAAAAKEARYVNLILEAYRADPALQSPPFHGTKASAFVLVGPVDAPVTEGVVGEAVDAARRMGVGRVDVLGFEFEMGLAPRLVDEARAKGVAVALRYIPKDVFDRRAVEKGQVSFHDLAYIEARAAVTSKRERTVTVSLTDFGVSYRQDDVEALVAGMKAGSKVTVDGGQVVKVTKDKAGAVTRDVLTKQWTDWIDYWAVDFDYASQPETIHETVTRPDGSTHHVPQWTGRYIFENEWQSFRTRKSRTLELTSASHAYATPGRKAIAVKVIDIFGNDTTKVIGVEV